MAHSCVSASIYILQNKPEWNYHFTWKMERWSCMCSGGGREESNWNSQSQTQGTPAWLHMQRVILLKPVSFIYKVQTVLYISKDEITELSHYWHRTYECTICKCTSYLFGWINPVAAMLWSLFGYAPIYKLIKSGFITIQYHHVLHLKNPKKFIPDLLEHFFTFH